MAAREMLSSEMDISRQSLLKLKVLSKEGGKRKYLEGGGKPISTFRHASDVGTDMLTCPIPTIHYTTNSWRSCQRGSVDMRVFEYPANCES